MDLSSQKAMRSGFQGLKIPFYGIFTRCFEEKINKNSPFYTHNFHQKQIEPPPFWKIYNPGAHFL